jgi:hypothetical protein
MYRSPSSAFAATADTVRDIHRLLDVMKSQAADLQDTIKVSRVALSESHRVLHHANELTTDVPLIARRHSR